MCTPCMQHRISYAYTCWHLNTGAEPYTMCAIVEHRTVRRVLPMYTSCTAPTTARPYTRLYRTGQHCCYTEQLSVSGTVVDLVLRS